MKSRIFISSVQREFAKERKADGVYLPEVDECDIYLGIFGHAYAMFLRKYVEQTGTGTGDIIARCRKWGLPDPKWRVEDGEDFVMVMPRPQSSVRTVDKSVDGRVDRTCDHVLNILRTNPRITIDQVAEVKE